MPIFILNILRYDEGSIYIFSIHLIMNIAYYIANIYSNIIYYLMFCLLFYF